MRRELVRPDRPQFAGEDAFRFRHLLIRDAAYDALPKSVRAELHERFADWLEEHGGLVELIRALFERMLADADEHVRDVARRCPGLHMRPSGHTPLEGESELTLMDRDNNDEVVVVGTFSSLQVRQRKQG